MKHSAIAFLFLCSALVWAAPSASDYSINVHVRATRMVREGNSIGHYQYLSVVIDGKKYELESLDMPNALLVLDDYKARLLKDPHWVGTYDSWRVYEVLLPENRKRKFLVVGQSE